MFQETRFANGVRIISRHVPGAHSVALGLWLINGSRHAVPAEIGYAHLLEHLLFKGTLTHSGAALAQRFAAMGGQINAHTGRELAALHGVVPAEDAAELLALFVAMLLQPGFDDADVQHELAVIQQEQQEIAEDPEEDLEEWAISQAWREHPLAWPILGQPHGLAVTASSLRAYLNRILQGERLVVVAVGAVLHDALLPYCAQLADLPQGGLPATTRPSFHAGVYRRRSASPQSRLLWLMPVPGAADPAYPVCLLANHLLGGSANAYLFRELRERLGLVYHIHSRLELYADAGLWAIHCCCPAPQAVRCQQALAAALSRLLHDGFTPDQLERTRRQLRASLLIEADRLDHLMERLAREAIYLQHPFTVEEWVQQLREVSSEQILAQIRDAWAQCLLVVG